MDVESERVWGKEMRIKREGVKIDELNRVEDREVVNVLYNTQHDNPMRVTAVRCITVRTYGLHE